MYAINGHNLRWFIASQGNLRTACQILTNLHHCFCHSQYSIGSIFTFFLLAEGLWEDLEAKINPRSSGTAYVLWMT